LPPAPTNGYQRRLFKSSSQHCSLPSPRRAQPFSVLHRASSPTLRSPLLSYACCWRRPPWVTCGASRSCRFAPSLLDSTAASCFPCIVESRALISPCRTMAGRAHPPSRLGSTAVVVARPAQAISGQVGTVLGHGRRRGCRGLRSCALPRRRRASLVGQFFLPSCYLEVEEKGSACIF
jgi:hypothetical protein